MIDTNLIIGRLGSGKTTAIRQLLKNKPDHEIWAIIVNEFGQIGIDAALLSTEDNEQLSITEIAGGCICCAAQTQLHVSVTRLIREFRPERILIEATGLGHAAGIVDLLRGEYLKDVININSVIAFIDINLFDQDFENKASRCPVFASSFKQQVQLADIIVLNKSDLSIPSYFENAHHYLSSFYPRKKIILPATQAKIDIEWLNYISDSDYQAEQEAVSDHYHPKSEVFYLNGISIQGFRSETNDSLSFGYILPASVVFNRKRILSFISTLIDEPELSIIRLKAVLNCRQNWYGFNAIDKQTDVTDSFYRRDNRIEIISTNKQLNTENIKAAFLDNIVQVD